MPLAEAEGAILAHTHRLTGRVLRKGQVLDAEAVALLRQAGLAQVIAARLESGDITEDDCARRLADRLVSPAITASRAATGRVNLIAGAAGLLRVDSPRVDTLNLVDESLTLGTLPDYSTVHAGDLVATVKVIPFAVPGTVLARAEDSLAESPLHLHPFKRLTVGLVVSILPGLKESVIDGTIAATGARVRGLTGHMLPALRCPHETGAIADCLHRLIAAGANLLLVAGASAVVDRRDVAPAGIIAAGGRITQFGMPVDPGNLICIGDIGTRPALVLPGCARSPRLNGIDWVLSRLFAGLTVDRAAVARMGVGGLLKEAEARPLPRKRAVSENPPPNGKRIAAVVLAAGKSSRMAPHNKLLLPDRGGKPMIARVVDNVLSSPARPVIVVTGHMRAEIEAALIGKPVRFVHAEGFAEGLSASLRAGLAAVPDEAAGALICLGDMPLVTGRMLERLIDTYDSDEGRLIVVPGFKGKLGNPMLWDRRFFPEMRAASGDAGARFLLSRHAEDVAEVAIDSDAVLRDFDTVASLEDL